MIYYLIRLMVFLKVKFIGTREWVVFYLALAILFVLPFCFTSNKIEMPEKGITEKFNPELQRISSFEEALIYIDSLGGNSFDTLKFVKNASTFTKEKFYHGLAEYQMSENWVASLSGTWFWGHLSAIVNPDDILKHSKGLCSQQTIVFMEILKSKGIKTRSVGLGYKEGPGHFVTEVYYKNAWHLYDVNMEPDWNRVKHHHQSMQYYLMNKDTLYQAYEGQIDKGRFYKIIEKVKYGQPNEFPAKNMRRFHNSAKIISYFLPIFFLLMAAYSYSRVRKKNLKKEKVPSTLEKIEQSIV